MIEEVAVVTRTAAGKVWIKSLQSGACGGCAHRSGCATQSIGQMLPKREFAIDCGLPLQPGDQVRVAIDDSALLKGSLLLYLLPLLLTLPPLLLLKQWLPQLDAWLPELALGGLLLAFAVVHRLQAIWMRHSRLQPNILGKC